MRRAALIALFLLAATVARAADQGFVVSTCGAALANPYIAGQYGAIVVDLNGNLCTGGLVSGSAGAPSTQVLTIQTPAADPCQIIAKTTVPISQTSNARLFVATTSKKNYICSIVVNGSDAENLSIVEGTGSTCGTNTAAILGATTAAAGMNFQAGGGFSLGNGNATVMNGTHANFDVCLFQSGGGQVSGTLTFVQF